MQMLGLDVCLGGQEKDKLKNTGTLVMRQERYVSTSSSERPGSRQSLWTASYRPVPTSDHFRGHKGPPEHPKNLRMFKNPLDTICV